MNSVRSNNLHLKCQRFTQSGYRDTGIRKLELWQKLNSFKSGQRCPGNLKICKYSQSITDLPRIISTQFRDSSMHIKIAKILNTAVVYITVALERKFNKFSDSSSIFLMASWSLVVTLISDTIRTKMHKFLKLQ